MTLQDAYQAWQQQEQNRQLFAKTRDAFRKAWFQLPTNKPCEFYTKEILGEALAATDQAEENKAKAASVMVHVLAFAHCHEPDDNPAPTFTFGDLMKYTKAAPEKKRTIRRVDDEICQLDLRTLAVIKRWPHPHRIMQELGVGNVARAIERCGVAGGYYWSYSRELDTFPERLAARQQQNAKAHADHCAQMRASKTPTQRDRDTEEKPKAPKKTAAASPPELGGARGGLKKRTDERKKPAAEPAPVQTTPTPPNSGGEAAAQESPRSSANRPSVVSQALAVFTDEELFAELDRRGWHGCFSRTEIVTIGTRD